MRGMLTISGHGIDLSGNDWTRYYTVHILKKNPDVIVVEIREKEGGATIAVCGESPEEALANYQNYQKAIRDQ